MKKLIAKGHTFLSEECLTFTLFYSLKEQFSLENRLCSEHFMKWKTQGRKYQIAEKRFVFMHYPSCVTQCNFNVFNPNKLFHVNFSAKKTTPAKKRKTTVEKKQEQSEAK